MSRYLISLILLLACTHFTAQQQSINTVFSSEEILKEAKSGHFQWVFHNQTTQEEIANLAKYTQISLLIPLTTIQKSLMYIPWLIRKIPEGLCCVFWELIK